MFNGIIESIGTINHLNLMNDCLQINITPQQPFSDLTVGASIAVNGVCLTITNLFNETFDATIVPETLRITNLSHLCVQGAVNLERSLKIGDRMSGHYVQGHIDGIGEIIEMHSDGENALFLKILIPDHLRKYVVNKGSIALDGMSITIIESNENWFSVTLIPHTQQVTIANQYNIGTKINIEVDILSKHIEKLLGTVGKGEIKNESRK